MAQLEFLFDKKEDIWNIWDTANSGSFSGYNFSKYISPQLLKVTKGFSLEKCKKNIEKYNHEFYNSGKIEKYAKTLSIAWNNIEPNVISKIEQVLQKPMIKDKIMVYITTAPRCPYNLKNNSFFTKYGDNTDSSLSGCAHEIMHLIFHKYYFSYIEKKVGNEKAHDIKESLTVLLNLEFEGLWKHVDQGYPNHEELRKFIISRWAIHRDMKKLLEESINFVKVKDSKT